MAAQADVAEGLDTLVCDGKTLRGSIAETASGTSKFIAQESLYSQTLGVAIAQTTYATDAGGEIQALRQLLEAVELELELEDIAVRSHGIRDGKPTDEIRYDVTSLRTGAKALLRHVRDRWSIENSWHWVRDVPLREDAHRYRESNGVQIMATLRSLAINALRLDGIWSITEGIAALAHDIRGLLKLLGWREPRRQRCSG
jgi:predicted transposase YbfD/YdcC